MFFFLKRSHGGTMHGSKELPFEQRMKMKNEGQLKVVSRKLHEEFQLPLELGVQTTACWRWCCWWIWGICFLSLTMAPRPVRELRRFPNMHTYCFSRALRRRQCSRQSRARCRLSLGWWNFWYYILCIYIYILVIYYILYMLYISRLVLGWVFSCRKCSWNSNWLNWRTIEIQAGA